MPHQRQDAFTFSLPSQHLGLPAPEGSTPAAGHEPTSHRSKQKEHELSQTGREPRGNSIPGTSFHKITRTFYPAFSTPHPSFPTEAPQARTATPASVGHHTPPRLGRCPRSRRCPSPGQLRPPEPPLSLAAAHRVFILALFPCLHGCGPAGRRAAARALPASRP